MDKVYVACQCLAEVGSWVLSCATGKTMNMGTKGIKAAYFGRGILKINCVQENRICVRELMVWDSQSNLSASFCLFFCCPYEYISSLILYTKLWNIHLKLFFVVQQQPHKLVGQVIRKRSFKNWKIFVWLRATPWLSSYGSTANFAVFE